MRSSRKLFYLATFIIILGCGELHSGSKSQIAAPGRFPSAPEYGATTLSEPTFDSLGRFQQYLVHFVDPREDSAYEIVDSFLSGYAPVVCDSSALAFMDRDTSCLSLITMEMQSPRKRCTVTKLCHLLGQAGVIESFRYRRSDSLLIFSERRFDQPRERTTIATVKGDGSLDTVDQLDQFRDPVLSQDGTEVLLITSVPGPDGSSKVPGIGVYDLSSRLLTRPIPSNFGVFDARKLVKNGPLFYVRVDSSGGSNVWCYDQATGEHQISFLSHPEFARRITLTPDTLQYQVLKSQGATSEFIRVVSMAIDDTERK